MEYIDEVLEKNLLMCSTAENYFINCPGMKG
jgi:hypothetical protein